MVRTKATLNRIGRFFRNEFLDKFRFRRTEKPHIAGTRKKSHTMIGPISKTSKGLFEAELVPARAGSQFNLLPEEHATIHGLMAAASQLAMGAIKKFDGIKNSRILFTKTNFSWKVKISPAIKIKIIANQIEKRRESDYDRRKFEIKFVEVGRENKIYASGNLTFFVQKKS